MALPAMFARRTITPPSGRRVRGALAPWPSVGGCYLSAYSNVRCSCHSALDAAQRGVVM